MSRKRISEKLNLFTRLIYQISKKMRDRASEFIRRWHAKKCLVCRIIDRRPLSLEVEIRLSRHRRRERFPPSISHHMINQSDFHSGGLNFLIGKQFKICYA